MAAHNYSDWRNATYQRKPVRAQVCQDVDCKSAIVFVGGRTIEVSVDELTFDN